MFPSLLLMLTKFPAFPCASDCYQVLEWEDKAEATQSLTLPVCLGWQRGEEGKTVSKPQQQSRTEAWVNMTDMAEEINAQALLSQKLPLFA